MRPVLFELGSLEVKSYGVFVALAFVGSWWVLRHELGRRADRAEAASRLILAAALGGLVGARLYWYAEHGGSAHPGDLLSAAGFTWYGGVLGGAATVLIAARRQRLALTDLLGAAAPALALGYALGRIACQFAGDGTYGAPSDLPWAMSYPHGEVPTTERVHPTPVHETLAGLVSFWVLWRLRERLSACGSSGSTSCWPAPSASWSSSSGATTRSSRGSRNPSCGPRRWRSSASRCLCGRAVRLAPRKPSHQRLRKGLDDRPAYYRS